MNFIPTLTSLVMANFFQERHANHCTDSLLSCCQYVNIDIILAQSEGILFLCDAPKNSGQYYDVFGIAGVSFRLDLNCISRSHT